MKRNGSNRAMMASKAQMPRGWRLVCLGDVAEVVMGQSPPGELVSDWDGTDGQTSGLPFIQGNAEFGANFPNPVKWCTQLSKVGLPGDILISVRAPVGETNRADRELGIGRGLAAVRFNKREQAFGWHILNHAKEALERVTQGSTFQAIGGGELCNLPILLPPLPEQRAIAAVLDSIDDAIESAEAVIAATEELRDSLLHQLLTHGVPGWHSEWKEVPGLGTLPAGWDVVRLGEVAEVNPRRPRLTVAADTPVTFLPMSAIAENAQGIIARELRPYAEVSTGYTYFEENDLLFSKITPCLQNGKHTLAKGLEEGFGFGTTEFHVVRADARLVAPYLFRVLTQTHIIERCAKSFTGTAGQQRIQPETLKDLPLSLPPLSEQQAIAALLDGVDATLERARTERDGLQLLKESTADALLTGRVRVG